MPYGKRASAEGAHLVRHVGMDSDIRVGMATATIEIFRIQLNEFDVLGRRTKLRTKLPHDHDPGSSKLRLLSGMEVVPAHRSG